MQNNVRCSGGVRLCLSDSFAFGAFLKRLALAAGLTLLAGAATAQNQPPVVSLTSPTAGTQFNAPATITLTANASDPNGTVQSVSFYRGSTLLGTDTTAPYSYTWTNVAAGTYSLTARARDNQNATTTSTAVSVTVVTAPNQPPTVSLTAPADGATYTAPATVALTATAADSNGTVSSVAFYNGATLLGTDTSSPYSYNWTNVAAGTYSITARATDNNGAVTTSTARSITVTPANQAPSLTVTTPTTGQTFDAPATINFAMTASDADGSVARVEIIEGGSNLLATLTSAPYNFTWSNVPIGTKNIVVQAIDNLGAVTQRSLTLNVMAPNQLPTVSLTSPAPNVPYIAPAALTLSATAADPDGTVANVAFYNGTTLLSTDTTSPYSYSWNNVAAGTYSLTARVTDNRGGVTQSTPVNITVGPAQTDPVVALTAPTEGAEFLAPAQLTVSAYAHGGAGTVTKVEFFSGTSLILSDTSAPYTFTLNASSVGQYSIYARVTNSLGAVVNSAPVSFNVVSNLKPTVQLTAPANGSEHVAPATLILTAQASDANGTISSVAFYNGDALLGTTSTAPYSFTWNNVQSGSYRITARATDNGGAVGTSAPAIVNVVVDPASPDPRVTLTTPATGSSYVAPATINLSADAIASSGRSIAGVTFFNGNKVLGTDTTAPYTYNWVDVPLGSYELKARVTDSTGVSTTSASSFVNVTPSTTTPSVVLTAPLAGAEYLAPASLQVSAAAYGGAGTVSQVEFYSGSYLIYTDTSAPYSFTLNASWTGQYSIYARVTNSLGETVDSLPIEFSVVENYSPSVQLTSPSAGSVHFAPATLTLEAQASDADGTVTSVAFHKADGYGGYELLGESTAAPYTFTWNNIPAGTYELTAHATDDGGATRVSTVVPVTVVVSPDAPRPVVSVTSPTSETAFKAPANISISANVTPGPDRTIPRVFFYNGATLFGFDDDAPYQYEWNNVPSGTYQLTVRAIDDIGAEGESTVTVVVAPDDRPPTVRFVSPAVGQGFVGSANIALEVEATANPDRTVASVSYYNGATLLGTVTTAPYVFTMNSVQPGVYAITAQVTDSSGAVVTSTVRYLEVAGAEQLPTLRILHPQAGTQFTAPGDVPLTFKVTPGSLRTVKTVEIYNDASLLYSFTPPYVENTWLWSGVPAGTHTVTIVVTDNHGAQITSAPISVVVVEGALPVKAEMNWPGEGEVVLSSNYELFSAYIQDPSSLVDRVEFLVTHNGVTNTFLGRWAATSGYRRAILDRDPALQTPSSGNYVLVARALNASGGEVTRSAPRNFSYSIKPYLQVGNPINYLELTAPASIPVTGSVSSVSAITGVEVYLNETMVIADARTGTGTSIQTTLTDVPAGVHDVRVRAVAVDGSVSEQVRRVRVMHPADPDLLLITEPTEGQEVEGNYSVLFRVNGLLGSWNNFANVRLVGSANTGWGLDSAMSRGYDIHYATLPEGTWRIQVIATTYQGATRSSNWVTLKSYRRRIELLYPGSPIPTPGNSMMYATAVDCTGCIAAVEFYTGSTFISQDTTVPYAFLASGLTPGVHSITAKLVPVDSSRPTVTSAPYTINVVANATPTASLTSPVSGDTYAPGSSVTIAATAADDGVVSKVEFYAGEVLLGTRTASPYTLVWTTQTQGQYVLTARVTDNYGAVGVSAPVTVNIGNQTDPNAPETITYIHTDISGSPLAATNANGNIVWKENYQAYGSRKLQQPGSEGQRQWFHGKEQDVATGLQYFGARYYDPIIGRFLGVDPVNFLEENLHSFNRYTYGNNNPVKYLDPDGNLPILAAVPAAGAVAFTRIALWLGTRQTAAIAVAETGAMVAAGAAGPGIGGAEAVVTKVTSNAVKNLGSRVDEVHGALDPIAATRRTTAGLDTADGTRILASGGRDLTKKQRDMLLPGEIAAKQPGAHAEVTALKDAAEKGLRPNRMSVSRKICSSCKEAIENSGGTLTSPTTATWPK